MVEIELANLLLIRVVSYYRVTDYESLLWKQSEIMRKLQKTQRKDCNQTRLSFSKNAQPGHIYALLYPFR